MVLFPGRQDSAEPCPVQTTTQPPQLITLSSRDARSARRRFELTAAWMPPLGQPRDGTLSGTPRFSRTLPRSNHDPATPINHFVIARRTKRAPEIRTPRRLDAAPRATSRWYSFRDAKIQPNLAPFKPRPSHPN